MATLHTSFYVCGWYVLTGMLTERPNYKFTNAVIERVHRQGGIINIMGLLSYLQLCWRELVSIGIGSCPTLYIIGRINDEH